ncbi:MAG: cofactor-independent phosphoglycerate mutase [Candidatus Altiarchaeales archaeon]|nr:MAG: cofactor-independent phosphoglycerate mutase [Candidatus Altiarchaeales archaeon]RLI94668.1 MAG: cofactor-independent phosphoglycerate mutase [Candidatus Altiarchaeales archaeon]RLI94792.1 MAG: cofactor-independent phosphoglycerate mutase [Candidatus Altiarchaeales archaeon]HDO82211.1 cofactor-independent phosphoglycerate mutase [Candidatus Altiarchaeales archaeon]HEX54860.1 cofactor-independent phosphoglycerate mutase [Candidatus Altiarchaeales archaeon]
MKYIVIVGDGMADYRIRELGDKTPLEVADKPNMDFIASEGMNGLLRTIPEDMEPGSDIANLSILGYDPKHYYPGGRGPLEAISAGIKLKDDDIVFRCNLITERDSILIDYSAGHISNKEARDLVNALNEKFANESIRFYPGVSYRNLLVIRNAKKFSMEIKCTPPHDIIGRDIRTNLIVPKHENGKETAEFLNNLILKSKEVLENHIVNIERMNSGKNPANMIWLWGFGRTVRIPKFREKFNLDGSLISAVTLLKGIGHYIGLNVIDVPGATGYLDTNYENKARYALKSLDDGDFVYVHVEAPDEASHEGSIEKKIKAIEDLDRRLISKILNKLSNESEFRISILTDHATPISIRTHTRDPVPFAIYAPMNNKDSVKRYDENSAKNGTYGIRKGTEFMNLLLKNGRHI